MQTLFLNSRSEHFISEVLKKLPYKRSEMLVVLVDSMVVTSGERLVNWVKNCSKMELKVFLLVK